MTTHDLTSAASSDVPIGITDPRALFARAVALGGTVIEAVGTEQMADPTPCPELDVRRLLDHLVLVLERVGALGRGEDPFAGPPSHLAVADGEWRRAWADAARSVEVAWSDDAALTRLVRLPWSELPGAATLAGYLNEITVHTWDLAAATGQRPAWDPRVIEVAFDAIRQTLPAQGRAAMFAAAQQNLPEELRTGSAPFGEVVEVASDAAPIDRLVAWNGRRPEGQP